MGDLQIVICYLRVSFMLLGNLMCAVVFSVLLQDEKHLSIPMNIVTC